MNRKIGVLALVLLMIFTATGCIHEEVTYEFNKDGTGGLYALFTVSDAFSEGSTSSEENFFGITEADLQSKDGIIVTQNSIVEMIDGEQFSGTEIRMSISDMNKYISDEGGETLKITDLANGNKRLEFIMTNEDTGTNGTETETTPEQTAQTVAMMKSVNVKMALNIKTDHQVVSSNGIKSGEGTYSWDLLEMALNSTNGAPIPCTIEYMPSQGNPVILPTADQVYAKASTAVVLVNGIEVMMEAYNINGNNYFKLRDVAMAVNGTQKQFGVEWDSAKKAIDMTSNTSYQRDGSEMRKGDGSGSIGNINRAPIYKDGVSIALMAYNIKGYNYFKLRDLGAAFNIGIDWEQSSSTIRVDTLKGYELE